MVRFGLFLTNQQPLGADQVVALDEQVRMVHAARDGGFDAVWAGQHYLSEGMTHIQPVPYLARLAPEAGDMAVGMGINLLTLANPVDVAETFASLDVVTGGRLIYGAGIGYRPVETAAFGVPKGAEAARFEANLRIVTALWAGESVDADLPWCRLAGARLSLLPVQRPRPPVWMAANSDGAVRRAARLADTWLVNPHATRETVLRQLGLFREVRAAEGRPGPEVLPLMREVFCAPTREEAVRSAAPYLSSKYAAYARWGQDKVMPDQDDFAAPYEELAEERFVVGSPDDCVDQLAPWRDVGVDFFVLRTHWSGMPVSSSLRSIELLADKVLPALRGA